MTGTGEKGFLRHQGSLTVARASTSHLLSSRRSEVSTAEGARVSESTALTQQDLDCQKTGWLLRRKSGVRLSFL